MTGPVTTERIRSLHGETLRLTRLVEDLYQLALSERNWNICSTGFIGWVDLILLDIMLPGRDALEICREIRTFSQVPIIMITARVEEIDRILGLELGADDYICKPFSPREVVARGKAVLRRTRGGQEIPAKEQDLVLDEERYQARLQGRDLELTAVEFKLLKLLMETPSRIYGREQIMARIYPDDRFVNDRTVDSHIKKLRQKIQIVDSRAELIHSVYGVGYKFEPVSEDGEPEK